MVLAAKKLAAENQILVDMYHKDIACGSGFCKTARGVTDALAAYRQRTDSRSAGKRSNWMITCAINVSAQEKGDYALLRIQEILS